LWLAKRGIFMSTELDVRLLLGIHHLLRQKTDLSDRLEKGPRVIKAAETNVTIFQAKVDDIKASVRTTKMKANEKQLQLGEREAHIEKLTMQRNGCDSNREFQLLNDQIAADQQANGVLQDEILELLEKLDSLDEGLTKANSDLAKMQSDSERVCSETQSKLEATKRDLADVKTELTDSEAKLPFDIRVAYKRLVLASGENALSNVEDKTCSHCMKIINVQTFSDLTMSRAVFCTGCGSLMYMQKTAAAT